MFFFDSLLAVWVVPATHETECYTLVAHGGATGTVLGGGMSVNGCSMFVRGLLIDLASPTLLRARRVPTVPKLDGIRVRSLDVSTLKCITKGRANHRDESVSGELSSLAASLAHIFFRMPRSALGSSRSVEHCTRNMVVGASSSEELAGGHR